MLTFFDRCEPFGRRNFLRVGAMSLGGLALPSMLRTQQAFAGLSDIVKDRSVVFLFMHGGPSQTETFDPKMTAPSNIRSATGEIQTKIPGITFGSTFPKLAALNDKFSIIRSFVTGDGNHDIKPIVGRDSFGANIGSYYSRVVGANNRFNGIPTNAALYPRSVDTTAQKQNLSFGDFASTGSLGNGVAPFIPGAGGTFQEDLQLKLSMNRITDRHGLLTQLDGVHERLSQSSRFGTVDSLRSQAFSTIIGGAAEAFDLSQEDKRIVARYDTSHIARPDNISKRWNNYNNYVDNGKTLGKLMLLARRLCERGSGFVTVTTNFVWDMHADVNNATMTEGMQYMGYPFDHAVSAFIEDCENRGLSDKILLVCCGEMGRTPKLNDRGGRDHWGGIAPLLIYGGGLAKGQVIGESDRHAAAPSSEPIRIQHLIGTIMNSLFHVGDLRLVQGLPREVASLAGYDPIPGLA